MPKGGISDIAVIRPPRIILGQRGDVQLYGLCIGVGGGTSIWNQLLFLGVRRVIEYLYLYVGAARGPRFVDVKIQVPKLRLDTVVATASVAEPEMLISAAIIFVLEDIGAGSP